MNLGTLLILILLIAVLYYAFGPAKVHNCIKNLPGPPQKFFFGNVLEIMNDPLTTFTEYSKKYGGIFRYWYFSRPVVVVTDPDLVKQILSTKSKSFLKDQDPIILDVIGKGLLLANGDLWWHQRNIMTPAFGFGYMKQMVPLFVESTETLLDIWSGRVNNTTNVHSDMTKLTLDVIGLAGFGYNFRSQVDPNGKLPTAVTTVLHETEERIFQFLPFWRIPFYPSTVRLENAKKVLLEEISKMIHGTYYAERQSQGISEDAKDLLGRLLAARDSEGNGISHEQLRDELITFLIAGHETTAAMLAFVFYNLSQYPEVEKKLHLEIDSILGGRTPEFDDLNKMHYLDLVIKETMRLYPSVSMQTTRITVQAEKIGEHEIPAGTDVEIWPWLIHRNERYWNRPLEFIPERHEEKRDNQNMFSYIPFGAGPRECIGKKLALTEAKVIIAMACQKYHLKMASGHKMEPRLTVTLRPNDLVMNVFERQIK